VYKAESICDPQLESAWFQPLSLKCDFLVSKFAFKWVNLCRYAKDQLKTRFGMSIMQGLIIGGAPVQAKSS
jgi:hypothetical protein